MPITTCVAPASARAVDRFVEHRDERVDALDREALHAHVCPPEESLEPIDFGQPLEQRFLLVVRQRFRRFARLDGLAEPLALRLLAEVLELVRERAAIELAHALNDVRRGAVLVAKRRRRNLREIGFA